MNNSQKQAQEEFKELNKNLSDYFCGYCFLNRAGLFKQKDVYFILSGLSKNEQYSTIAEQVLVEHNIKFTTESGYFVANNDLNFAFDKFIVHQKYRDSLIEIQEEILDKTLLLYGNSFIPILIEFQKLINPISLYEENMKNKNEENKGE